MKDKPKCSCYGGFDCPACNPDYYEEQTTTDTNEVSLTPRTDAFIFANSLLAFSEDKYELTIVHARQLERELAASQAKVEQLTGILKSLQKSPSIEWHRSHKVLLK